MSKHKKKKGDEWVIFVNNLLRRRRSKRDINIPNDYLLSVADAIHRTNPTKEIVFNKLKEVYCTVVENIYIKCLEDIKFFRDKQNKAIESDFKKQKDSIDDLVHTKSNQNNQ
jgi:hypothetical protein